MSNATQDERPFLSIPEQRVKRAVENLIAKNGGVKPPLKEVQKEMKRLKYKTLSLQRISEVIKNLQKKSHLHLTEQRLEIVKQVVPA